jgi:fibronectin type 3 domain-containing protein
VLKTVMVVIGAILVLNVLFVLGLALLEGADRRRRGLPLMSRRHSLLVAVAAGVLAAGTALATPDGRDVVTSAFEAVTGTATGPDQPTSTSDGPVVGAQPSLGTSEVPRSRDESPLDPSASSSSGPPAGGSTSTSGTTGETAGGEADTGGAPTAPPVPTTLTATATSSTAIQLTWLDVAGEDAYRVERSADGNVGWTVIAWQAADVVGYTDSLLASGATFFYRVVATNDAGDSGLSDVASATTTVDPASPPTVTATALSSSSIELDWSDVEAETGFRVERSTDGGATWTAIATTGQDVTSYTDSGLTADSTYSYRVFATNAGGDSAPSEVVVASTMADPGAGTS